MKKQRVTGIGGVFFKAKNPKKLSKWYQEHLGMPIDPAWCGCIFEWKHARNPEGTGTTVWSAFDQNTKKFGRGRQAFMINYRVGNLKRVLNSLKREGVWVDTKTEDSEYGKFGWIKDPEGNRIELWEPPEGQ